MMVWTEWNGWTAFFQTLLTLIINAFINYTITKHLIKGVYEKHKKKLRFWQKKKTKVQHEKNK